MIYVMSDIHGYFDKFIAMLSLINFNNEDYLYILGDVIDRGEIPIKCLQYIMNQKNMELLLGNHEEMMLQSLIHNNREYYECWQQHGGVITLDQFDGLSFEQQKNILSYLKKCSLYKIINNYILVHAGINSNIMKYNNKLSIEDFMRLQTRYFLLWVNEEFINYPALNTYKVIFGHTPTNFMQNIEPYKIWNGKDKIGIDCGVCFNGRLGCLRLDDMKEFYI